MASNLYAPVAVKIFSLEPIAGCELSAPAIGNRI